MLTDKELKAIRARCEAAKKRPWQIVYKWENGDVVFTLHGEHYDSDDEVKDDLNFVGHSRDDIPALLDEVKRLQRDYRDMCIVRDFRGRQRDFEHARVLEAQQELLERARKIDELNAEVERLRGLVKELRYQCDGSEIMHQHHHDFLNERGIFYDFAAWLGGDDDT